MMMKGSLPPNLPTGIPVPPGMTATDSITQTLATMPPDQLLDILSQMKVRDELPIEGLPLICRLFLVQSLVTTSPEQARNLLNAHPSLSYALFQAMVLMKVVDPAILQRMLAPALGAPAPAPIQNFAPQQGYYGQPAPAPTYQQQLPPQPSYAAPQPAPAPAPQALNPQAQAQLLQQVMAMSQAQIDALPPKDRDTIMALRAQLGAR
jgi:cleavage stimulation factor subunit 2